MAHMQQHPCSHEHGIDQRAEGQHQLLLALAWSPPEKNIEIPMFLNHINAIKDKNKLSSI